MPKASVGRVILAVVAGWLANAALVGLTEVLLWTSMPRVGGKHPGKYYVIDLICQCCYTLAGPRRRVAMFGMMFLGLLIGGLSLPSSWPREPHWYSITLLMVWVPCVWTGWSLRSRRAVASQSLQAGM